MIASILVGRVRPCARRFWTASRLEETCVTVALKRKIAQLVVSFADVASGLEQLVCVVHVNVTLTIERGCQREGTIFDRSVLYTECAA